MKTITLTDEQADVLFYLLGVAEDSGIVSDEQEEVIAVIVRQLGLGFDEGAPA